MKKFKVYDLYDNIKETLGYADTIFEVKKLAKQRYDDTDGECMIYFAEPDGRIIEVQYHTDESFDVKENQSHKIYELQRQYAEGTPEFEKYDKQIDDIWNNVKRPDGVEKIAHKNWRG